MERLVLVSSGKEVWYLVRLIGVAGLTSQTRGERDLGIILGEGIKFGKGWNVGRVPYCSIDHEQASDLEVPGFVEECIRWSVVRVMQIELTVCHDVGVWRCPEGSIEWIRGYLAYIEA